jgi:sugar lactone lactonase YvrE
MKLLAVLFLVGCGGSSKPAPPPAAPPAPTAPVAEEAVAPAEPAEPPPAEPVLVIADVGLATPESVLYDEADDVYFVSNINGSPGAKDGNGFITKLSPDGAVVALKWVDGAAKGTPLNAPKGMAIANGLLFVADLDVVRVYDKKTGKAKGTVTLKGATFANDVAAGPDGTVYVSDSGVTIDDKGITPNKSDAVWAIDKKLKAKVLAKGAELGNPNGHWATDKGVWVCTFGTGEIYLLDAKGGRSMNQKVAGMLDGIYAAGDDVWVSSWEQSAIMRGAASGEFSMAQGGLPAPADFGYDTKRHLVLVPLFNDNKVVAYSL